MPEETITTTIKTGREVTDAIKNSLSPIFEEFEEEIKKAGGKVLVLEVRAKAGYVKLAYGFDDLESGNSVFGTSKGGAQ